MRAAIYARFSTDKQRDASIEDQARNCRRRIASEGWQFATLYKDQGISGATSARPGYQQMLEGAMAREYDVLLIDDQSRLSRDQIDSERTFRSLEHVGVRVISVSDGYDSNSKGRKVHRAIKSLMSELYLDDLRDKTHRGLEGRAIAKFSAGGLPFGYRSLPVMDAERVIGFRREAHPEHAAIVVEIFERFSDGATMRQIASDLNARGVPSPGAKWKRAERRNDGRWLVSALHALLHNEIYSGRYIWNRSEWLKDPDTGRRIRRERPESQWVVNDMPELALVAQPTWERVKARLASRSVAYGRSHGGAPKFLLSGLLRCEECGAAMTIFGGEPRRYGCSTHRHGGASACSMDMSAPRRVAEEIILRPVIDGLLSDEAVELALEEMRAYAGASIDPPDEATVRDIARLDAQIAQLERMVREGLLSPAVASAGLEQADSERRALLAATRRKKTVRPLVVRSAAETAYRAEASRLHAALTGKVVSVAREALREVVGEVKVRPAVSRKYLEAQIRLSPVPLLKVAGADHYSIGSGGRI